MSKASHSMKLAIEAYNALAVENMFISGDDADRKLKCDALMKAITELKENTKAAEHLLKQVLNIARSSCKHVGAPMGSNERDGSWMGTCPTCGLSK